MDRTPIDVAGLHQTNEGGAIILDQKAFRCFTRRLRYRGLRLSPCREFYYHPMHWASGGDPGFKSPGDTWGFSDAFTARTPEARAWLEKEEEQ